MTHFPNQRIRNELLRAVNQAAVLDYIARNAEEHPPESDVLQGVSEALQEALSELLACELEREGSDDGRE
jgi:hypothetical protein